MVLGHTTYNGYTAQQHNDFFNVFKKFLTDIKPSRILEIGTAGGGFILAIREILNEIGLNHVPIKSFEVINQTFYDELRDKNIEIIIDNIFDHSYLNLIKHESIVPYIQSEGITLVFCDGGHKIGEFNSIAPHIKKGDFIMAHDYVDTWENYKNNFVDKIWNWCEIEEKYISEVSKKENLEFYNKEEFDKIVWVCKIKK